MSDNRMPWTSHLMREEEFEQWLATRKDAGLKVDIETCEIGTWATHECDPYGFLARKGGLADEMKQIGTNRFVRSVDSCGWICEDDLPTEKVVALYDRLERRQILSKLH